MGEINAKERTGGDYLSLVTGDMSRIDGDMLDRKLRDYFAALVPKPMRVLLLPPDYTRYMSHAGSLTARIYRLLKESCRVDVLPATGSHDRVSPGECEALFEGAIPYDELIVHNYREDVRRLGEVPADFVSEATDGLCEEAVPVEVNRHILNPVYDLVISLGQVVPHEVAGMANHNKNIFVGCGGAAMINATHMIGATYGMERMMGRADTPVRKIFDYAEAKFLAHVPLLYVQTVAAAAEAGGYPAESDGVAEGESRGLRESALIGIFIGRGKQPFYEAAKLSRRKNVTLLDRPVDKVVAYLDEGEYKSTWVGNKAIYRTKLAIADGGELVILAPGVAKFGEDRDNDALLRKYGYPGYDETLRLYRENEDLQNSRAVAAHMIHSSTNGRVKVTYAVRKLGRAEVEGAGFLYQDYDEAVLRYNPAKLEEGYNHMPDGERVYFISKPAIGLWVLRENFKD